MTFVLMVTDFEVYAETNVANKSFKEELKNRKKKYDQISPNHQDSKMLNYQDWGLKNSMVTTRSGKHSTTHL